MRRNNDNDIDILDNNKNDIDILDNLRLSEEDADKLRTGLDEIERLSSNRELLIKSGVTDDEGRDSISSFEEAFPSFITKIETDQSLSDSVNNLSDQLVNSKVLDKLFEKKSALDFLSSFRDNKSFSNEEWNKIIDIFNNLNETEMSQGVYKPLGKFGEKTLNEVLTQGFNILEPIRDTLQNIDVDGSILAVGGSLITLGLLFNSISKAHSKLVFKGSTVPTPTQWDDMSARMKLSYERMRLKEIGRFKLIAAPLLVLSLFAIKEIIVPRKINVSFESSTKTDVPQPSGGDINQSFSILGFLKKLPNFIGKAVIGIFVLIIINYFLTTYSINFSDPFFLKYLCMFCLIISSIMFLNYLILYFIYIYLSMHKNISISKSLPKKIYTTLDELQTFIDFKPFIWTRFYFNFLIYGFLILIYSILLYFFC